MGQPLNSTSKTKGNEMKQIIESLLLENKSGERLRVYKVEGGKDEFCLGSADDPDGHFSFRASDAEDICNAIHKIVGGERRS